MKNYLAWVDGKATYGEPHKRTGYCSKWGRLYSFDTRKERDAFCDTFNTVFNVYPTKTNKKSARKYFLGMSVASYNEYLGLLIHGYSDYM